MEILFVTITVLYIIVIIIYKIDEYIYYGSERFKELKASLEKYIMDCNDLNEHIEELKKSYVNIRQIDYGKAELIDASRYNYRRPTRVNATTSSYIHECSAVVCNNAKNQPFKYVCKYFNIKANEESLENFEEVLNNFSTVEEGKIKLNNELISIRNSIQYKLPIEIRLFSKKKLMRKLGFREVNLKDYYFPTYTFRYISPGGNKTARCDVTFDVSNLNKFVEYLSENVKYKKSVLGQRALMTLKLRESIKQRDNYTCQICGLSVRDESNLLLEIDHIIPLSKGGLSTTDNLQTLCWKCNRSKGAKLN